MITFGNLGRLGRFANGMFQISGTIGIAKYNGYDFSFPYWKNYDHERMGYKENINVQDFFVNPLPVCDDPGKFREVWVNWGYHGLSFPDNVSLNGHMQSEKYFRHCIDLVRFYFRMKDEAGQNDHVAIHYRAGDYVEGNNNYHPRCTKEYYKKAVSLFPGSKFKIFSDDRVEAGNMFSDICDFDLPDEEADYIQDFKEMKVCKDFITANSSFSLMAAILGEHPEKKIICPKVWFGTDAGGLSGDDCYPENSIVL